MSRRSSSRPFPSRNDSCGGTRQPASPMPRSVLLSPLPQRVVIITPSSDDPNGSEQDYFSGIGSGNYYSPVEMTSALSPDFWPRISPSSISSAGLSRYLQAEPPGSPLQTPTRPRLRGRGPTTSPPASPVRSLDGRPRSPRVPSSPLLEVRLPQPPTFLQMPVSSVKSPFVESCADDENSTSRLVSSPNNHAEPQHSATPHHSVHPVSWGWGLFRSDMFSLLIMMVPLGLAASICHWAPKTVFVLCAMSLAGLEVFVDTTLERVSLLYENNIAASLLLEMLPILFPTMPRFLEDGGHVTEFSESALELIKLTLIATGPIMMTCAMIFGTAVILLVLYLSWVVFRRIMHRSDFADDDHGRRVAAELVRENHAAAGVSAAQLEKLEKKKEKEHDGGEAGNGNETSPKKKRVFSCLPTPIAIVVVPLSILVALGSAVILSYYLIQSISPLVSSTNEVGESSPLPSALKGHFVASILLPLIINVYNFMRSAEIASCGGRDVSLAVHMTYGAGASTILLTLPLLITVWWASGHTLNLDFASF
ncbi:Vacuolar calcium ion transporter [Sporothrix eucalyptigena]|uniref:Vacuolar calcium ion transporter n=1 Tax=Sporothrix eucalyptigena TaxID=1812306 RepID=A0ABP0B770_9PEZI